MRPRPIRVIRSARRLAGALLALVALVASSGCGDEEAADRPAPSPPEPVEPQVVRTDSLRSLGVGTDIAEKPEFRPPSGSPPQNLQIYDVAEGDGAQATVGEPVSMQYVGRSFSNGREFDASWDGEPFAFTLGAGEVISGWDLGIEGMREGGRRIIIIPPELGYGAQGSPPSIAPNETLVFVVDLKSVGS
ncbi:MAG: FKBP-type peptidyl-prolyl cis-trans isomerase [Thermoleophilaceae bacterium]|nr:FKBP-type peptidyl-prolyl cis-trans isomerase [Thermoleophilaceae bacterium]